MSDEDLAKGLALVKQVEQTFAERDALYRTALEDPEAERLRQRAVAGDADAAFELGVRYRAGRGVPQDPAVAYDWLHKAAVFGSHHGAKALLKKIDAGKV